MRPENWNAIHAYAAALERFAVTRNPNEFNEFHIPHEAMAAALKEIAAGADARYIFRQTAAPHRQTKRDVNRTRAFAYWEARIKKHATHQEAIRIAREYFSNEPPVSAATIARLANTYQHEALHRFECDPKLKPKVQALREKIAARSKRGKWD